MPEKIYIATRRDLYETLLDVAREVFPFIAKELPRLEKPPKEWLPNPEAQEYLGVSKSTLQRWRDDGVLPYSKVNGSIFYRRADLLKVLESHAA